METTSRRSSKPESAAAFTPLRNSVARPFPQAIRLGRTPPSTARTPPVLQTGAGPRLPAVAKQRPAPVSPGDQAGTNPAIHRQHHRPRGIARVPRGQPLLAVDRRGRRPGGGKGRRIVDLGIDAPFHVLRHRRAFLLLLQLLKLL